MIERSLGVKRLVLIFSLLSVIAWVIFIISAPKDIDKFNQIEWLVAIIGIPVAFYVPQLITIVIYWVRDGFSQDKNT